MYFVAPLHFPSFLSHVAESHAVNYNYCLFKFRHTFPNINIVATIHQACRVGLAIPYLTISAGLVVNKRNERIVLPHGITG